MLENVKVVQIARMEEYLGDEAPLWSSEESLEDSVEDLEVSIGELTLFWPFPPPPSSPLSLIINSNFPQWSQATGDEAALWIYLVEQTQPFPGILNNAFGPSPLVVWGWTRGSGIHGNTLSSDFEATISTRPGSTNETFSFITMISNLRACKWRLKWFRCGLFSFRTYYRLLRTLMITIRINVSWCQAEV